MSISLKAVGNVPVMEFSAHYKKMWPYVKPYWVRAIIAVALSIPIGALDAVIALSLKPYMDIVLVDKSAQSPAFIPLVIVLFTIFQGGLNYMATYMNAWVGMKITQDVKRELYKKLLAFEPGFFDKNDSGIIIQRFSGDVDAACTGLLDNVRTFASRIFSSISLIGVLIYNSWQLSIIAIIVLALALLPLAYVRRLIKNVVTEQVKEGGTILTKYNETYSGNKTVASYNLQKRMYDKYDSTLKRLFKLGIKMVQKTAWLTPMMHIMVSIGVGAVIGFGSYLIVNGTITSGSFVSFITALIMLYNPVKNIGKSFNAVQVSFLAIERISEVLDLEPEIKSLPNAVELKKIKKNIKFENVDFEYDAGAPVLKNISLDVKAGTTMAFVGNSGGGKSTIVSLLPRFYDVCGGRILIDGTDIREFDINSLRDKIAVVFQDNFLFGGTLRDNILLGKPDATEKEIETAVKMACLDDFVADLEKGLDTEIGERGALLSGGQRQRLSIARAFVKNAPIVILDEATSALDNKSEAVVQKAIENLMKDRTVFVIAHRLSTVQNADRIVVINDGQIVESGTHKELLELENGAYRTLYNAQFK